MEGVLAYAFEGVSPTFLIIIALYERLFNLIRKRIDFALEDVFYTRYEVHNTASFIYHLNGEKTGGVRIVIYCDCCWRGGAFFFATWVGRKRGVSRVGVEGAQLTHLTGAGSVQ